MIIDNFRIPILFSDLIINKSKRINAINIIKICEDKSKSILKIIRKDDNRFIYKNDKNEDCEIVYSQSNDTDGYEYMCKVIDSSGSFEENILINDKDIVYENYKNEKSMFAYESVGSNVSCLINGQKADVIYQDGICIIIDSFQNYYAFDKVFSPTKIVEEGYVDSDGNMIPTLKYSYKGDNLIIIDNMINQSKHMVHLLDE